MLFEVLGEPFPSLSQADAAALCQAAAIQLKNLVARCYWRDPALHKSTSELPTSEGFFPSDKEFLKANMLTAIVHFCHRPGILKVLLKILNSMVFADFPSNWATFCNDIMQHLNSTNTTHILGGL